MFPPELPNIPEEKPDEGDKSVAYRMTYKGIVAFEDNWPAKGDYDLNDVIVKYNSVLSFNTKNEVLSTEDEFTALWSGASYKIAAENYPFAIHLIDAKNFSTTEKESIDKSYPAFANWAKSNGAENKDWYK